MSGLCVWLAGASGLVGAETLKLLLASDRVARVVSVGRRAVEVEHPKLTQAVVAFDDPATFQALPPPDAALCCLGTTLRRAGSREAFRAVDYGAVVAFARAAREAGARTFAHVSSLGADPRARAFYAAVKGQAEEAVAGVGFESVVALRPSILDGERVESRPLEHVGVLAGRALGPLLGRYRPTPVGAVAATLVGWLDRPEPGRHTLEAPEVRARGGV